MLDDEANKDMDNNAVDGPAALAHVELATTVCKYNFISLAFILKTSLQINNCPSLILLRKLNNLASLNLSEDSSMINFILTATSLHPTYL
jgi:hypothetical protein